MVPLCRSAAASVAAKGVGGGGGGGGGVVGGGGGGVAGDCGRFGRALDAPRPPATRHGAGDGDDWRCGLGGAAAQTQLRGTVPALRAGLQPSRRARASRERVPRQSVGCVAADRGERSQAR